MVSPHFFSFDGALLGLNVLALSFAKPEAFLWQLPILLLAVTPLLVFAAVFLRRLQRAAVYACTAAFPCWLYAVILYCWDARPRFGFIVAGIGACICTIDAVLQLRRARHNRPPQASASAASLNPSPD